MSWNLPPGVTDKDIDDEFGPPRVCLDHARDIPCDGDGLCPLCFAKEKWQVRLTGSEVGDTFDTWVAIEDGLIEEWFTGPDPSQVEVEAFLTLLQQDPGRVFLVGISHLMPPECRRTEVARVCSWCGAFMGWKRWVGADAHRESRTVTHDKCDRCELEAA